METVLTSLNNVGAGLPETVPERVTVVCVFNPLDPLVSREVRDFKPGLTVTDYIREFFPVAGADLPVAVSVNSEVVPIGSRDTTVLAAGDNVAIIAVPRGGGDSDGKNIGRIIAMVAVIALAVVAPYVAGPYAAVLGAGEVGGALLSAGIMVAGGLLVNALFPSAIPSTPNFGNPINSGSNPTYGWEPDANSHREGGAVPVLYGKMRVCPPLIGRYIEVIGDKQYLNLLYAVADHELDSISDVWINNTPSENFSGVEIETRLGKLDQSVIQFFGDTRSDTMVGTKMSTDWVTRKTYGNTVQGFGVALAAPGGLYYANTSGGFSWVELKVEIQYRAVGSPDWIQLKRYNTEPVTVPLNRWSGGYWWYRHGYVNPLWVEIEIGSEDRDAHVDGDRYTPPEDFTVEPLTSRSAFHWRWCKYGEEIREPGSIEYDYFVVSGAQSTAVRKTIFKDNLDPDQYEIQARFTESPPDGIRYSTGLYFDYIQESVYDDFTYPGTALLAIRALGTAELNGAMPRVTCLAERSTVPVYDADGEIGEGAANNPAWASYDILRDPDYSGGVDPGRIIYDDFLSWGADWCDSKGYEVNLYFDTSMNVRRAVDMVSLNGRAGVCQIGSRFTCSVDRPDDEIQHFLFTPGNILKDSFQESWLPLEDRANAIELTYWDADLDYSQQTVEVQADDFDAAASVVKTSVTLYGCVSRQQALEYGKALLLRNRYLTLTASWEADIDALACGPGDVVRVSHDVPQWGYGGRVVGGSASTVTLDRTVTLYPGKKYALVLKHGADDTSETVNIRSVDVETTTFTISLADGQTWTATPAKYDLFAFGETNRTSKLFRVVRITRRDDQTRKISALEYVPEVYADSMDIPEDNTPDLDFVKNLAGAERWTIGPDGSGRSVIDLTWRGHALGWYVFIRESGSTAWEYLGQTFTPSYTVQSPLTAEKIYEVAVSPSRAPAEGQTIQVTVLGKLAPPSDVENFQAVQDGDRIVFKWDHVPDIDRWGYVIKRGSNWETGQTIVDMESKNEADWRPPLDGTYHFLIKAYDESEVESVNATAATITVNITNSINILVGVDELSTGIPGAALDAMYWNATAGRLYWLPGMTDTDFDPSTTDLDISDYCGDEQTGVYTSQLYDFGWPFLFTIRGDTIFSATVDGSAVTDLTYPDRTDLTFPNDTDLSITPSGKFDRLEFRFSADNVTFTDWLSLSSPVQVYARSWQVRAIADIDGSHIKAYYSALVHYLDVPDVDKSFSNQSIVAGGTTFTLSSLGVSIIDHYHVTATVLGTTAVYPVIDKASDRFTIRLFDAAGNAVAGNVDIHIKGF